MNDLRGMERELLHAIKIRDDWMMKGYDTPQLSWGEQLEMYDDYVLRIASRIEKELNND